MTPEVSDQLTRKIASLARLELTDTEVRSYTEQLKKILGYVEQLQKVDLMQSGVEVTPLTHPVALATPLREDEAHDFEKAPDGHPKVLLSAPESTYDGFKVPPIL